MGTFRSTYPMMSEAHRRTSVPQFAWFHPANYMASTTNELNPFQGTQDNPQGLNAIPIRSIPINEAANTVDAEAEPINPTKKLKISRKNTSGGAPKEPKVKKAKKGTSKSPNSKGSGSPLVKPERKNLNFASCESNVGASCDTNVGIPIPFCSCTGVPRQCYRWGSGGWQSSCCTTNISEYPLPMSATRPGARTAGRKMSHGPFEKLLQRLAAEGYDLTHPVDMKDHWARHGTNKFVTLK